MSVAAAHRRTCRSWRGTGRPRAVVGSSSRDHRTVTPPPPNEIVLPNRFYHSAHTTSRRSSVQAALRVGIRGRGTEDDRDRDPSVRRFQQHGDASRERRGRERRTRGHHARRRRFHHEQGAVQRDVNDGEWPPCFAEAGLEQRPTERQHVADEHRMGDDGVREARHALRRQFAEFPSVVGPGVTERPRGGEIEHETRADREHRDRRTPRGPRDPVRRLRLRDIDAGQRREGHALHQNGITPEPCGLDRAMPVRPPVKEVVPEAERVHRQGGRSRQATRQQHRANQARGAQHHADEYRARATTRRRMAGRSVTRPLRAGVGP